MAKSAATGTDAAADTTPRAAGFAARIFQKAFGAATPAERKTMIADAAIFAGSTIKADIMDGKDPDIHMIEDLWVDGPESMPPHEKLSGGVTGDHAGGTIITGPTQAASGANAKKQSADYSRPAMQEGAQRATEKLGDMLKAIRDLHATVKNQINRTDLLASAIVSMVDDVAAAKSLAKQALALSKAEKEDGEGSEEEEADDEAKESESGSGTEIEITNEMEEDDEAESDDDKAKAVSASRSRVAAKSRLRLAKNRLVKAVEADADGNVKAAARHRKVARVHVARAKALTAKAKATRPEASVRLAQLEKSLRSVAKAIPEDTENQEKWPDSDGETVGGKKMKSEVAAPAAAKTDQPNAEVIKTLQAQIEETHKGLAMFRTTVDGMMQTIAGVSRGSPVPPGVVKSVVDISAARGSPEAIKSKVEELYQGGAISRRDADSAEDVVNHLRAINSGMDLDPKIVEARVRVMPDVLRELFNKAA